MPVQELHMFLKDPNEPRYPSSNQMIKRKNLAKIKEVYELPGGLANWVGSGNPIETLNKKGLSISLEFFHQLIKLDDLVLVDFVVIPEAAAAEAEEARDDDSV